jgi:tetratricopeptide (TPR) repeat protein
MAPKPAIAQPDPCGGAAAELTATSPWRADTERGGTRCVWVELQREVPVQVWAQAVETPGLAADTTSPHLVEIGQGHLGDGALDEAIEHFYRAIALDLEHAPAYVGLSNAFRAQAPWDGPDRYQVDKAISYGEKAVFLAPDDPAAHMALGSAYYWKRWYRQAHPHFERADELEPTIATAIELGFLEVEMGRIDRALGHFRRALAFDPTNGFSIYMIGLAERLLGLHDEALPKIQQALEIGPDQPVANAQLAFLLMHQGRLEEARLHAVTVAEQYPESPRLTSLAGLIHWYAGDDEGATDYFARVVDLPDADPLTGWWGTYSSTILGHLYLRAGRDAEAGVLFEHSIEGYMERLKDGAEGWGYMFDLARIHAARGERDNALHWFRSAIAFGFPEYASARIDPMLLDLWEEPEFQRLMAELEDRIERMHARADGR